MSSTSPDYRQAALIGGLVMGALSALPIVSVGNACCCLWVVSGGLVAAYVFQQNNPAPMTAADGALAGLLAGLLGAVIYLVVSIPLDLIMAPFERDIAGRILDMSGNMPSEMRDWLERFSYNRNVETTFALRFLGRLAGFIFMLCIGAIFSTLGGLLGAAIFAKKLPPGTIDVPQQ
jgi:hypothetical protein